MEIKKPFNNQQLTDAVAAHELEIKKLKFKETEQDLRLDKLEKKKKTPTKCGGVKQPRVTIADVMEILVKFQASVDERFNKLETSVDERFNKLETQVNKLETSVDERFNKLETSVNKLETQVQALNKAVFRK